MALFGEHRLLQIVDLLVQRLDDIGHTIHQTFADFNKKFSAGTRAPPRPDLSADLLHGYQPPVAQTDDAPAVGPEADGDHIFRVGAWIEVDPTQGDDEALAQMHAARPGLGGQQRLLDDLIESALLFDPLL